MVATIQEQFGKEACSEKMVSLWGDSFLLANQTLGICSKQCALLLQGEGAGGEHCVCVFLPMPSRCCEHSVGFQGRKPALLSAEAGA